jgi:hypothetical protein
MLLLWRTEDFIPARERPQPINDPWEPIEDLVACPPSLAAAAPIDFWNTPGTSSTGDFWDPLGAQSINRAVRAKDEAPRWHDDVSLPEFESGASENPFSARPERVRSEQLIERRARWLLSLLDVPSQVERNRYLKHFEELFDHFPHQSTFRALADLALEETSAQEIITAFHLRLHWRANPKLWSMRLGRSRTLIIPSQGDKALGWTRAVRLVECSKGLPPEMIIDEDWYHEWLALPFGDPAYWSFLDYIGSRLDAFAAGTLDLPRELRRLEERPLGLEIVRNHSIDGFALGSASRSGYLVRLDTDAWNLGAANAGGKDILSAGRV